MLSILKKQLNHLKTQIQFWKKIFFCSKALKKNRNKLKIEMSYINSKKYEGATEFWFVPSEDIIISEVHIAVSKFTDQFIGDSLTVYSSNKWYLLVTYEGVQKGQKWEFTFSGKTNNENIEFRCKSECGIY